MFLTKKVSINIILRIQISNTWKTDLTVAKNKEEASSYRFASIKEPFLLNWSSNNVPVTNSATKIWTKLVYTRAHLVYWQINSIEISWHLMKKSANNVNSEKCKEISLLSKAKVLIWYALLTFLTKKKKFNFDIWCNYCKTDRLSRKKAQHKRQSFQC